MREKSFEYVDMYISDDVFRMVYKPMEELDLAKAKKIVAERIVFKDGIAYPSLFDVRKVKSISKEARDYMANEGNELVVASALLINSPVLRMMGNFFIAVNKPKSHTHLFTSEEKAFSWLAQFKEIGAVS